MKKITKNRFALIISMLFVIAITSCEKEDPAVEQDDLSGETDQEFSAELIPVTGETSGGGTTKTTLEGFETHWKGTDVYAENADKVGIYSPEARPTSGGDPGVANAEFTALESIKSSEFEGEMYWGGTGDHNFYAYYPWAEGTPESTTVPILLTSAQTQSAGGNSDHIGALDFMVATPLTGVSPGSEGEGTSGINFRYNHVFTLLEFQITGTGELTGVKLSASGTLAFNGGTIDITQGTPDSGVAYTIAGMTGESDEVTVELGSPVELGEEPVSVYMMINPGDHSGNMAIGLEIGGDYTYMSKSPPEGGFERGKKYEVPLALYEGMPDEQSLDLNLSQTINTIVNKIDSDLEGPGLNLFGKALEYAYINYNKWDLTEEELNENSKVTVFAILNNIPYRTMTSQSSSLPNDATLSGNHLLKGSYTLEDLTDGTTLTTIDGETLTITHSGDDIYINNSKYIEEYDNINGNIVHVVYNQIFCSENNLSLALSNSQELLKDYIEYYYLFDAIYTDEAGSINADWDAIDGYTFNTDNAKVRKLYFDAYNILSRMVDISETFDLGNNLSFLTDPLFINSNYAQLRSMRAYVYFILQNYFYGVAILTDNCHNYELSRNNISEVWDYILSDIASSINYVPFSRTNDFIFNRFALGSLAGRINLLMGDYNSASHELKHVIDVAVYALEYPIDNIYNTASIETILGFTKQGILSSYLYEGRDIVPVFRHTEVILNYALSKLETGDLETASTWMEHVNYRSDIGDEITGTKEELKEILFQMITREINKEGTRLMYLKYFDKAESILGIPTYKKLLPIPLKQLIYNPYMTQNPGY